MCDDLATIFTEHDQWQWARQFSPLAPRANALVDGGWDQSDLNELGGAFPNFPIPVARKEPWLQRAAELYSRGCELSLQLRAIASW